MISLKESLQQAAAALAHTSASAYLDAEILLAHTLQVSRTYLYAHSEKPINQAEREAYLQLVALRQEGLPIAYITGQREFWSLPLQVNSTTLIPRPETERLVELTLSLLADKPQTILELGTGSGAIALALAAERPHWRILACDVCEQATHTARENAKQLNLSNVTILCSNWFASLPKRQFDAVISNPPYIAEHDPHLSQGDVRFEPRLALISGADGLEALHHIIAESKHYLRPGGLLLLEHGWQQKHAVLSKLNQCGYQHTQCWPDIQGHDRISGGWC
ncbi:peptide chain release factor N(5)-glutamine methyltransferase [Legionella septentrionalis]|uniref:peptide chain release factor N(5)-glutamine methyltransferase n=1 Tax=Legionella septentrionalis TaxID=2498109 RepID=UPI000F8D02C6|nr:peptide chain release factor N(5)-glutamine methyltransferase [Legionella septentrionalis]RUR15769.1 peptide chain release factor N(5)-glutamine methyltransferase [Legionella septentrionalis]